MRDVHVLWNDIRSDLLYKILSRAHKAPLKTQAIAEKYCVNHDFIESIMVDFANKKLGSRNGREFRVRTVNYAEYVAAVRTRTKLEAWAAEQAAGQIPPELLALVRRNLEATMADDPSWRLNEQVHELIARFCGNGNAGRYLEQLRYTMCLFAPTGDASQDVRSRVILEIEAEHLAILDALEHNRKNEASRLMRDHVQGDAWLKLGRYLN